MYLSRVSARRVNTLTLTVREEVKVWMRQYNGPNFQVLTLYLFIYTYTIKLFDVNPKPCTALNNTQTHPY